MSILSTTAGLSLRTYRCIIPIERRSSVEERNPLIHVRRWNREDESDEVEENCDCTDLQRERMYYKCTGQSRQVIPVEQLNVNLHYHTNTYK